MTSNEFMGMLVVALGSLVALIVAIVMPILKLNTNIVKLNTNFENMRKNDAVRDERIKEHGKEIDGLSDKLFDAKHEIDNHEGRIKSLENWRNQN